MSEPRPWSRATAWLVLLAPLFFASYGFANWLASRRAHVGVVVYSWEQAIPFLPWTIIPYWSVDLLYALSLFVCTTRRELDRHAQRLLLVQAISVACFLLFPLRFSFDRPDVGGVSGALFNALGSFDKPFNQAPSLHIGLLVVIWTVTVRHSSPVWRGAVHAWMALIGASVLTTYQHHFVDVPTGAAVGFAALWSLPDRRESPLAAMRITRDSSGRVLAARYAFGGLVCAGLACRGGTWLWLFWPALALLLVAMNYLAIGARGFQKQANGQLSIGARGLLAPYLAAAWINSRIWTRRHPRPAHVTDGVWIGRIPTAREFAAAPFDGVVDVAAELSWSAPAGFYRSIPMLDLIVPPSDSLREASKAIEAARAHGRVLVTCALGFSRSAAAVAAWLLRTGRAPTVDAAMQIVRAARPAIVLEKDHRLALEGLG